VQLLAINWPLASQQALLYPVNDGCPPPAAYQQFPELGIVAR